MNMCIRLELAVWNGDGTYLGSVEVDDMVIMINVVGFKTRWLWREGENVLGNFWTRSALYTSRFVRLPIWQDHGFAFLGSDVAFS